MEKSNRKVGLRHQKRWIKRNGKTPDSENQKR